MTKAQLLKALQSEVSPQELAEIKAGTMPHISSFNAKLICDLMEEGSDSDAEIADAVPQRLREVTNAYLAQSLCRCRKDR